MGSFNDINLCFRGCQIAETSPVEVGLALTQILIASDWMRSILRQSGKMCTRLVSVNRILDYHRLPSECQRQPSPSTGSRVLTNKIEFQNVFYRVRSTGDPILNDISFAINPNEKIAIISDSESVRRAFVSVIFRLNPIEGSTWINGINTIAVDPKWIRANVTLVQRNPTFFSGTLRSNLDPLEVYTEVELWQALRIVQFNCNSFDSCGLDTIIFDGSDLSCYQKQLVYMAKAILDRHQIVVIEVNDNAECQ